MELDQATRSTRREALKKLAATSAAATLTATVISSRAFADGGTQGSQPTGVGGTIGLSVGGQTPNSVTFVADTTALNTGACPFGDPVPNREFLWEVSRQPANGNNLDLTGGPDAFGPAGSRTVSVLTAFTSESYRIKISARWVCDQSPTGTTAAWLCRAYEWLVVHDEPNPIEIFLRTTPVSFNTRCATDTPSPP